MFQTIALVFLGGRLGSLARLSVSLGIQKVPTHYFPTATLISNVTSCVVMGLALGFFADRMTDNNLRMFILVGFCGGFSTFSTFSMETVDLFRRGETWFAILNVVFNIILCMTVLFALVKKTT